MVVLSGHRGSRSFFTSARKALSSKVNAAPRLACAVDGSGMADS